MMPRDVTTRWNSTYDMLEFAVEHREALDSITGNQKMKLRQYELTEEDWKIATKLRDVLKVCDHLFLVVQLTSQSCLCRFSRMQRSSSRAAHPASPLWSLRWIISMSTLRLLHSTPIIPWPSKQHSLSGRWLLTGTMTRLTILKFFVSQWVWFVWSFSLHVTYLTSHLSFTPSTQAGILWESWVGGGLDREGRGNCSYRVWAVV